MLLIVVAIFSLLFTWWWGFSERATITVASKRVKYLLATYDSGGGEYHVEWSQWEAHYMLYSTHGSEFEVSRRTYDLAQVGESITLRLWVTEWRQDWLTISRINTAISRRFIKH